MSLHEVFSEEDLTLLRQRAERVAAPLRDEHDSDRLTALEVIMRGERYALPINLITLVYNDVVIISVPCVPDYVAGIANVRGHLVSVLELAALLGLEGIDNGSENALVVAQSGDANIGFRAQAVGEVIELALSEMNPVPSNMNLGHPEYLRGIFADGTALLDLKAILEDERLSIDEATA